MNNHNNSEVEAKNISRKRGSRRIDILQAMAQMLHSEQWQKITTAALAKKIGFSEAALYRHYRSKAEMLNGLIDFIDQSFIKVFKDIDANANHNSIIKLKLMVECLLVFSANNPGLTRVLTGEVLQNENQDLQKRMMKILLRIEEGWKINLREAVINKEIINEQNISIAPMLMSYVIGCWWQFSKSGFTILPNRYFDIHWKIILQSIK